LRNQDFFILCKVTFAAAGKRCPKNQTFDSSMYLACCYLLSFHINVTIAGSNDVESL